LGRSKEKVSLIGPVAIILAIGGSPGSIRITARASTRVSTSRQLLDYNGGESESAWATRCATGIAKGVSDVKIDGRTKAAAAVKSTSLCAAFKPTGSICSNHEVIRDTDPDRIFAEAEEWRPSWRRERRAESVSSASRSQEPDIH